MLKCACGGNYRYVPDEEVTTLPPSFTARQLYCEQCNSFDWRECDDLGLEEWPEVELASSFTR